MGRGMDVGGVGLCSRLSGSFKMRINITSANETQWKAWKAWARSIMAQTEKEYFEKLHETQRN